MVPVRTSVKELLSGLFTSIPGVYVFCVIELLQDPVIPPFFLQDDRTGPVFRMEVSHDISIIHMALGDIQCPSLQLCFCPVCDSYIHIQERLLHGPVHDPPDGSHERCPFEAVDRRFPFIQLSSRFMVLRGMAFLTDRDQVPPPVGSSLTPVYDMMDVKDHAIMTRLFAALTGVIVTGKDLFS